MRRGAAAILGGIILSVASGSAYAVAPPSSWAGFYVGGTFGYGFDVSEMNLPDLGLTGDTHFAGAGARGYVGGGLAGYNFMIGPRWLAGVEADGNWQNIKTKVSDTGLLALDIKGSMDWSASVRARIGYVVTPTTMMFVTGGWSWSELTFSDSFPTSGLPAESLSKRIDGPQIGFGVETMFASGWIMRSEYLHSFYGRATFNSNALGQVEASPWVGVVRSALIYKWGPQAPAVSPDRNFAPIWDGFYAGGMIGSMMGNAKIDTPLDPITVDGLGFSGVVPSALVGYNILVAPRWLLGVEGEIVPRVGTH